MTRTLVALPIAVVPDKVIGHRLDRLAIVYVRPSTLRRIEHCREATRLQCGLADRACGLGWARPEVMVIDEDLGASGASAEERAGFQTSLGGTRMSDVQHERCRCGLSSKRALGGLNVIA